MDLPDVILEDEDVAMASEAADGFRDIVESIYNDKAIFPGSLPESPPDSSSGGLLSPGGHSSFSSSPPHHHMPQQHPHLSQQQQHLLPDLSCIDYSVPLKLLEGEAVLTDDGLAPVHHHHQMPTEVIRGATVVGGSQHQQNVSQIKAKRKRKDTAPQVPDHMVIKQEEVTVKSEPVGSPLPPPAATALQQQQQQQVPSNIRFSAFEPESWKSTFSSSLRELPGLSLAVTADKGFVYSALDAAFIAQKKNHFQVTCQVQIPGAESTNLQEHHYVKTSAGSSSSSNSSGSLMEISFLQLNFYGVKLDAPDTRIRVEQSQSDRTKVRFDPLKLDPATASPNADAQLKVSVGRLHFTETTANNMRKKGRPNPAQKYFQLVAALEAVVHAGTPHQREFPLCKVASERIVVRASNPGQFEPNSGISMDEQGQNQSMQQHQNQGCCEWRRGEGDVVYHAGKVAVNTEHTTEALSVHGNVQLTGQLLQPSDLRVKERIREVDSKRQLDNVKALKIVEFRYKREYVEQLPEELKERLGSVPQTGVIAQDVQRILPDAVSRSKLNNADGARSQPGGMLLVDKERIFLENVGAVRELSKVTGHLETRIGDLERATETVEVKLSRLRRGSQANSSCSSSGSSSAASKHHSSSRYHKRSSKPSACSREGYILHNRCAQMVLFILAGITLLSLTTMAVVYIVGSGVGSDGDFDADIADIELDLVPIDKHRNSGNSTTIDTRENEVTFDDWSASTSRFKSTSFARPVPSTTTTTTRKTTTTTIRTTTTTTTFQDVVLPDPSPPPVIGDRPDCLLNSGRCQVFCCGLNHLQQYTTPGVTNDTADDVGSLDNNLTAPGDNEDLEFHPDVLFVQDPFFNEENDKKDEEEIIEDDVVKLVKSRLNNNKNQEEEEEQVQLKTLESSIKDSKLLGDINLEKEEDIEVEPEEDKSNQVLDEEEFEDNDEVEASKAVEEDRKGSYAPGGSRVVFKINEILPKPEEKVTSQDDVTSTSTSVSTSTTDKINLEDPKQNDNELEEIPANREVRLLKPEPTDDENLNQVQDGKLERNEKVENISNKSISISEQEKDLNEVIDIEPKSQEDTTENVVLRPQERAKREIADMFQRIMKRLVKRNVDETEDFDRDNRATESTSVSRTTSRQNNNNDDKKLTLASASAGNYSLDERFCDQNADNFEDCRRSFRSENISLSIPLSQHFGDSSVDISLNGESLGKLCPVPQQQGSGQDCFAMSSQDFDTPSDVVSSTFSLDVASRKLTSYKIRQLLTTDADEALQLCQLPAAALGTVFREYNVVFYRVCHL